MPEEGKAPPSTGLSTRGAMIAGAGVAVILGLAVLTIAIAGPLLHTHEVLQEVPSMVGGEYGAAIERLGGQLRCCRRLRAYLRLPDWVATRKRDAVFLLASCGDRALPALREALKVSDKNVRLMAIYALCVQGKTAVPALCNVLDDPDADIRRSAAWALGKIGTGAGSAIPVLKRCLEDEDESVRAAAAEALKKIRGSVPQE